MAALQIESETCERPSCERKADLPENKYPSNSSAIHATLPAPSTSFRLPPPVLLPEGPGRQPGKAGEEAGEGGRVVVADRKA